MKKEEINPFNQELYLPELTARGILLGTVLTVIFTASNVYLGLKVGLTFSSAIPAAVISMATLKVFKNSNILENNIVQTQAAAAGTLSAIIFIIPGLLMIGYWQGFEFWQTLLVSACGGCLGVLFTIPLRRAMVVHSDLPYPEGLAAAEILKVGSGSLLKEQNAGGLKEILSGTFLSGFIALCTNGFSVLSGELSYWFALGQGFTQIPLGFSTALLGAGYLVGIASGIAMFFGVLIAWGGFVPYFTSLGAPADGQTVGAFAEEMWSQKVRLIGAGTMGVAAVWTLITLAKPVVAGVRESIKDMRLSQGENGFHRTDMDISFKSIIAVFGIMLMGLLGAFYSFVNAVQLPWEETLIFVCVGTLVAVFMGFLVAATCAYMAGLIGSSSSPISGIGILGIIVSSVVVLVLCSSFGIFDMPNGTKFATAFAIFTSSVILSIACVSNDNIQDLKTGFLVGATPWRQQVALMLGCLVGAIVIAPVLNLLYEAYGFPGVMPRLGMDEARALSAPQAVLMTTISTGIFNAKLAWEYIYMGLGLGVLLVFIDILLRHNTKRLYLPPLAIGMGIYLPPTLQMPLVIGAVMGYLVHRYLMTREHDVFENSKRRGTLFASGLIVGESVMGVILSGIIVFSITNGGSEMPLALVDKDFVSMGDGLGLLVYLCVIVIFVRCVIGKFQA
jgi:putative OPT family oligopeptide transporter